MCRREKQDSVLVFGWPKQAQASEILTCALDGSGAGFAPFDHTHTQPTFGHASPEAELHAERVLGQVK